jgi:hypothetical protein
MKKAIQSANGLALLLTVLVFGYEFYYFLGAPVLGVKQLDSKYFGMANFDYWFGFWGPGYLTALTLLSSLALSANSGSTAGRVVALLNLGSSLALGAFIFWVKIKYGDAMEPVKQLHLAKCVWLSVQDIVISAGVPYLVSLGMRTMATSTSNG